MSVQASDSAYLGTEKIGKLLLKFGIPGVISLVVNSIYNVVDQIFIGQGVGYLGNGATNVIYPLTIVVLAFGFLIGDGAASYISLMLGSGKKEDAARGAAFGIIAPIILGIVLCIFFLLTLKPVCALLGATEANFQYCLDYGYIIVLGFPASIICCAFSSIIRADGSPKFSMCGLLLGCVINIIFDPIFIFALNMGMHGAALATIMGQYANAVLFLYYAFRKFKFVTITKAEYKLWYKKASNVCRLGLSSFIFQLSLVIAIAVQNNVQVAAGAASKYGSDIPLAAFGVTMKVFSIVLAVVNGFSTGAQPIYGYNYGTGSYKRVKQTYIRVFIISEAVLCAAFALFQLSPMTVVNIFGASDALYNEFAVLCLKIFLLGLPLSGLQSISGTFFQSVGYPLPASLSAISRQILFMIPALLILTAIFGLDGCLYMGPVADLLSLILTIILLLIYRKKIFPKENS